MAHPTLVVRAIDVNGKRFSGALIKYYVDETYIADIVVRDIDPRISVPVNAQTLKFEGYYGNKKHAYVVARAGDEECVLQFDIPVPELVRDDTDKSKSIWQPAPDLIDVFIILLLAIACDIAILAGNAVYQ
jgi:hypothetical protein